MCTLLYSMNLYNSSIIDGVSHLATEQLGLPMIFNLVEVIYSFYYYYYLVCEDYSICQ